MVKQRYGKIVNIASVSAMKGGGSFGNVLYGTTKAGVVALTKGLARELAPFGINVNAIAPGVVETGMTNSLLTPERRQSVLAGNSDGPLRRHRRYCSRRCAAGVRCACVHYRGDDHGRRRLSDALNSTCGHWKLNEGNK